MKDHSTSSDLDNQAAFSDCAYGDREDLAKRFTQYLDHRNTTKGAYAANLNGAWGTGKTFFVDNWCQQLKEDNRLAIKIDAWESDYLKDPLAIIVAELLEQVKVQSKLKDTFSTERKVAKIFTHLSKSTISAALMGAGKVFLGEETYKDFKEVIQETGHALSNLSDFQVTPKDENLGEFGLEVFKTHKKHKAFVIEFIKLFQDLLIEANRSLSSETINDQDAEKIKTYIFIDELDRCRPTYAIEMLETVKHLFNIPNLVFVLSTDTAQLEHSIKAVYGEGFDAREYLSRFFEQRLLLPIPDHFTFLKSKNSFESLGLVAGNEQLFPAIDSKEKVSAVLAMFCEFNQVSLRRTLQFADKLEAILFDFTKNKNNHKTSANLFELIACLICRDLYPLHSEKLIWSSIFSREVGSIERANNLKEPLRPLLEIANYEKIITLMIQWSNEILSLVSNNYEPNAYNSKFSNELSNSNNPNISTINNGSFRLFTCQEHWVHWEKRGSNNTESHKLLDQKEIDNLVTINSIQFGNTSPPSSSAEIIFETI